MGKVKNNFYQLTDKCFAAGDEVDCWGGKPGFLLEHFELFGFLMFHDWGWFLSIVEYIFFGVGDDLEKEFH